jgi:hypothetical protein
MEEAKQQRIDFSRGDQLAVLRECRLPDVAAKDGVTVKAGVIKGVLGAIDSFGRECFASIDTIAATANYSRRHVKRAIEALELLSLITKDRRKNCYGTTTNHYRIVWTEVELLATKVPCRHYAPPDQSAFPTDQSALEADHSALEALKPPRSAKKNTPPPPRASSLQRWAAAEEVFRAQGIGQSARLIEHAQRRGITPDECEQLAEYFAEHATRNGWGPGVLFDRVANAKPGEAIAARWIPPTPAALKRAQAATQERQRLQASLATAQARAATSEAIDERQSLEARYGPALDALPRDVQRQLVGLVHKQNLLALRAVGKSGLRCWVRADVLEFIAAEPAWLDVLQAESLT